jgi:hypothetical protein
MTLKLCRKSGRKSQTYEFLDNTVDDDILEVSVPCMPNEILHGLGCMLGEEGHMNITHGRMYHGRLREGRRCIRGSSSCCQGLFFSGWLLVEYVPITLTFILSAQERPQIESIKQNKARKC